MGNSDISGEISFPLRQQNKMIRVNLQSKLLDLAPFLATAREQEYDINKSSLFERELPPQTLQELNGILQFDIGHLHAGDNFIIDDIKLNAKMHRGHIQLNMTADGERLKADVDLKPGDTHWRLVLNHKGRLDLNRLIKQEQENHVLLKPPLVLDVNLNGRGRSLSAVLGSADGSLLMELGAGQLSENISRHIPFGGVLSTVLETVSQQNSAIKQHGLECVVFQLDISNGIAISTRGLALRTKKINVLGGGSLKLSSGEIELQFKTAQRKGLGLFNVLGIMDKVFGVTGTLQHPRVRLNVKGALIHGGAAWATGGLSLLYDSLFKRLTAFSNPCETVLKSAHQ